MHVAVATIACLVQGLAALSVASGASRQAPGHGQVLRVRLRRAPPLAHRSRSRSLLQLGAASAAASLPGQGDQHLYGTVYLGIPRQAFNVAFDTASGNLILPSRLCRSSACLSHNVYDAALSGTARELARIDNLTMTATAKEPRETVSLNVGSGHILGQLVSEHVCLGEEDNICAETVFVEATEMSEEPFGFLPYDGVLGLGMPGTSLRAECNFLSNLAEVNALHINRFAIWLAGPSDTEDSEISFGDFDGGRIASQDLLFMRVERPESGIWQLSMTDFVMNNQDMALCKPGACFVGFDSGSTVIGGPKTLIDPLLLRLKILPDCSNYKDLPLLGFAIGEYTFNLEPKDYVKSTHAGCFHQFAVVDVPPPRGPVVLLGEPFLRRFYTVFDRPTLKMGLALAKHKGEVDTEMTSRLLVKRQAAAPSDD